MSLPGGTDDSGRPPSLKPVGGSSGGRPVGLTLNLRSLPVSAACDRGDDRPIYEVDRDSFVGAGREAAVFRGVIVQGGTRTSVAFKEFRTVATAAQEYNVLMNLRHANIIKVAVERSGDETEGTLLGLQLVDGGNMKEYIQRQGPMEEGLASRVFKQLASAVAHCHEQGYAHRDIKHENVLLALRESPSEDAPIMRDAILCDFGCATKASQCPLQEVKGSLCFAAPEIAVFWDGASADVQLNRSDTYDPKAADCWSLGVCLFFMLTGLLPWGESTLEDHTFKILKQNMRGSFWRFVNQFVKERDAPLTDDAAARAVSERLGAVNLSQPVRTLLSGLLCLDVGTRMTAAKALVHPWVVSPDPLSGIVWHGLNQTSSPSPIASADGGVTPSNSNTSLLVSSPVGGRWEAICTARGNRFEADDANFSSKLLVSKLRKHAVDTQAARAASASIPEAEKNQPAHVLSSSSAPTSAVLISVNMHKNSVAVKLTGSKADVKNTALMFDALFDGLQRARLSAATSKAMWSRLANKLTDSRPAAAAVRPTAPDAHGALVSATSRAPAGPATVAPNTCGITARGGGGLATPARVRAAPGSSLRPGQLRASGGSQNSLRVLVDETTFSPPSVSPSSTGGRSTIATPASNAATTPVSNDRERGGVLSFAPPPTAPFGEMNARQGVELSPLRLAQETAARANRGSARNINRENSVGSFAGGSSSQALLNLQDDLPLGRGRTSSLPGGERRPTRR